MTSSTENPVTLPVAEILPMNAAGSPTQSMSNTVIKWGMVGPPLPARGPNWNIMEVASGFTKRLLPLDKDTASEVPATTVVVNIPVEKVSLVLSMLTTSPMSVVALAPPASEPSVIRMAAR